ncbi:MAG: FtsW/RodA/SpoVE family cell cycle protein [Kiritimatiellaeota bacterium]|nr:FtsW/RodA/SpoVE family cell cycle protein [Kiritimatiellota bacterium]
MQTTVKAVLLVLISFLVVFGLAILYSTTYAQFGEEKLVKQAVWIAAGTAGAYLTYRMDYRLLTRHSGALLIAVGISLLYLATAAVLYGPPFRLHGAVKHFPFVRRAVNGAFRWFRIGGYSIQPSEFAKIVLILYLADYYNRHARHVELFMPGFFIPMFRTGLVIGLILLGRNLSVTVITGAVAMTLAFVAGVRLRFLAVGVLAGAAIVCVTLWLSPNRSGRLDTFRDPEKYAKDRGYQLWHSQLALGSGGLTGQGFTSSRMKQYFLPEAHTDFIMAIVGEELGFLMVAIILTVYLALAGTGFWLAAHAPDRTGMLVCTGVSTSLAVHAFVNLSVVSGFSPTTGVTAPFISYGGSSILACFLGVGLLFSVARQLEADPDSVRGVGWEPRSDLSCVRDLPES